MQQPVTFPQISLHELEILKKKLLKDRGFDLSHYTPAYVQRRVNACLMRRDCTFAEYLCLLNSDPNEYQKFFDIFTINVTEFFRDPSVWNSFAQDLLPQIFMEKLSASNRSLRIWSAGCSSGEEPYSIAILLREAMEKFKTHSHPVPFFITIQATDIDDACLEKARTGTYSKENVKNVSPDILEKYFKTASSDVLKTEDLKDGKHQRFCTPTLQHSYTISDEIKKMVTFRKHHFFNDQPFTQLDIVCCRNATIYLTPHMKDNLLEIFYRSLNNKGILIIGKAEMIFSKARYYFYPVNTREHIFRKERRDSKLQVKVADERRKNFYWKQGNE